MIRCAKMRLIRNTINTPAETKIIATIATLTLVGKQAQTMRMMFVTVRAMQKPKRRPLMMNL